MGIQGLKCPPQCRWLKKLCGPGDYKLVEILNLAHTSYNQHNAIWQLSWDPQHKKLAPCWLKSTLPSLLRGVLAGSLNLSPEATCAGPQQGRVEEAVSFPWHKAWLPVSRTKVLQPQVLAMGAHRLWLLLLQHCNPPMEGSRITAGSWWHILQSAKPGLQLKDWHLAICSKTKCHTFM